MNSVNLSLGLNNEELLSLISFELSCLEVKTKNEFPSFLAKDLNKLIPCSFLTYLYTSNDTKPQSFLDARTLKSSDSSHESAIPAVHFLAQKIPSLLVNLDVSFPLFFKVNQFFPHFERGGADFPEIGNQNLVVAKVDLPFSKCFYLVLTGFLESCNLNKIGNLIKVLLPHLFLLLVRIYMSESSTVSSLEFVKIQSLSSRELVILNQINHGMTNSEIGEKLFISPFTVKNHLHSIYKKLGVKNRFQAVKFLK